MSDAPPHQDGLAMRTIYRVDMPGGLRSRWIRLEFSQSFKGQPVRPLLRLHRAIYPPQEWILPAAVLGRARWIGLGPPDLEAVEILAALGPGQEIRIDKLAGVREVAIAAKIFAHHLSRAPHYLLSRFKGDWQRGVMARTAFDLRPVDGFAHFASERERPLEPAGLDIALVAQPAAFGELTFIMAALETDEIQPTIGTLQSLAIQSDQNFRLTLAVPRSSVNATREELAHVPFESRIELVEAPDNTTRDLATFSLATRSETDWIAHLKPGDNLDPNAVLIVRDYLNNRPHLDAAYTDSAAIDPWTGILLPQLKPDWSPTFFEQVDYIRRPCFFRAAALLAAAQELGQARPSPWRSLLTSISETRGPSRIGHLKRLLLRSGPEKPDELRSLPTPAIVPVEKVRPDRTVASILVPTRDRVELLQRLIDSLTERTRTEIGHEVVIIDNESCARTSRDYLASLERRPGFRVVRHPGAFNFSELINVGVASSRGDCLILLNNDCEIIEPSWLDRLAYFAMQPRIGAVGALLLYDNNTIQHAGISLGLGGAAGHRDRNMPHETHYGHLFRLRAVHEVSAVTGACLAVARSRFEEVGGLDPALAVAFNDVDFCLKLQERGYRNLLDPGTVLKHLESASRGRDDGKKRRRFEAEAARFRERWHASIQDDPYSSPLFSISRFNDWLE